MVEDGVEILGGEQCTERLFGFRRGQAVFDAGE